MRISDWSSDVCSSDLISKQGGPFHDPVVATSQPQYVAPPTAGRVRAGTTGTDGIRASLADPVWVRKVAASTELPEAAVRAYGHATRSEERRVGKGVVSTGRSRGGPDTSKKKPK